MRESTALILEGGSLRCLFTAGVLDTFLDAEMIFPTVAGVSAGSLSGINYVAGQKGRTARVNLRFVNDKRYLGVGNLLRHRSVFNFDFLFGEVSQVLEPLDYEALEKSAQRFFAFSTDVCTGEAVAHEKGISEDILLASRASSSMPLLSPIVRVDGRLCMDGAVAGAVPLEWALEAGYERIVLVLTREAGYCKKPTSRALAAAYDRMYHRYPKFAALCKTIPERYGALQERISELEQAGRIFVIRPAKPVDVSRTERDVRKLKRLYRQGRQMAMERMAALNQYLQ